MVNTRKNQYTTEEKKESKKRKLNQTDLLNSSHCLSPSVDPKKMKMNSFQSSPRSPITINISLSNMNYEDLESIHEENFILVLSSDAWEAIECGSSGDCLFNSICFLMNQPFEDHITLRKQTVMKIRTNFIDYLDFFWDENRNIMDYLKEMEESGVWASEMEIRGLSHYLKRTIIVFRPEYRDGDIINFVSLMRYGEEYEDVDPLYIVYYRERRHYQALKRKEESISSEVPNENISDFIKEQNSNEILVSLTQEASFEEELLKAHAEKKYVVFSKYVDRYTEVWEFQKNNKIPGRFYQGNDEENNGNLIEKSKLTIDEKKKLKKRKNKLRNKRCEWKKGQNKFFIDHEKDRLVERKEVPYSHLPRRQPKEDWKSDKKLYEGKFYIPYQEEVLILLKKAHGLHIGRDRMRESIHCLGFSWEGMTKDINEYIKGCVGCKQVANFSKSSRQCKQLISAYPKQRYQIDCLKLYSQLSTNKYKVLICIVDHFSKFVHARVVESHTAREVEITVRQFFRLIGAPHILQSDNGREFNNQRITIYLEEQQVKFLHGRPYHPESQGCIERAHRTLQEGLKKMYIEEKSNFYIESALELCLDRYNMEIHSTTKMRPMDSIKLDPDNEKDKQNIDFVIYNTKNSRKNSKNVVEGYSKGDKILLYNYLIKGKIKNYLEEVRGKFSAKIIKGNRLLCTVLIFVGYMIPATVESIIDTMLEIKVEKDYPIFKEKVKKGEIYKVQERFVLQVQEEHWKKQLSS